MATERDRTPVADDAADRLAEMIEPGSLLEATPECLVVTRADGRILFANRRVEQLTGFDRDELVGRSVELLVAADILDLELGSRVEAVCAPAQAATFQSRCTWDASTDRNSS